MSIVIRSLISPLMSLIFLNLACGLFNTFVSLRLDLQGYSADTVGIVSSALYAGVLIGSVKLCKWISKVGMVSAFCIFSLVSAVLVLSHALWIDPIYWGMLRILSGICLAGIFIVVESWFLLQSSPEVRGGVLSIYLGIFYLALSAGQFLINFSSPMTVTPFCITAGLLVLSAVPMKFIKGTQPPKIDTQTSHMKIREMIGLSPLGFFGGVVSGMVLGAVYGLMPVYAVASNLKIAQIGALMSVLIFGGLIFQWPMGRFADKSSRKKVLSMACFGASIFAIIIGCIPSSQLTWLFILVWIFGGFSFTIYPLSMAYMCENIAENQIVSATGGFVLSYGIGAVAGPLLAPIAIDLFGPPGLFYFLALVTSILGIASAKKA